MKVVDLHPEDLLEKDAKGLLTSAELERLESHLARCAVCRFEREVRADFEDEIGAEVNLSSQRLRALIEGIPQPAEAPRPETKQETKQETNPEPELEAPEPVRTPSTRPTRIRRSARVLLLIAAALFVGGVATAGAGARVWARAVATFGAHEAERTAPPEATAVAHAAPRPNRPSPAATLEEAPTVREMPETPELKNELKNEPENEKAFTPPPPSEPKAELPSAAVTNAPVALTHTRAPTRASEGVAVSPPARVEATESAAAMFDAANEARRQGDYARAVFLHHRLQFTYPSTREAHMSYATVGRLLLDRGDAAGALASFESYESHGHGPLDEAVLVGRATALERLGRGDDARTAWTALLAAFPDTPYAEHARVRLGGAPQR